MRSRLNIFLACLLAVQIFVIIVLDKPWTSSYARRQPATEEESLLFPDYSRDKAAIVKVTHGSLEITLARRSPGDWIVKDVKDYKADMDWVDRLLDSLAAAKITDVISDNPEKWETYEVDEKSGFRLQVWDDGGKSVVDVMIGKVMGPLKGTYVRMTGSNDVILVMEYIRRHVNKGKTQEIWLRAWRDKSIHYAKQKDVIGLTIEGKHGLIAFERRSGTEDEADSWYMTQPFEGEASSMQMNKLVGFLCGLTAQGFTPPDTRPEDVGLVPPHLVLTINKVDGTSVTFQVSKEGEEGKERYLRWVTTSNHPGEIFKVPTSFFYYYGNKPEKYLKSEDESGEN